MDKRGQFFLLAAAAIVLILFGLRMIYTSVNVPAQDTSVYDLSKEIKYEAGAIIDSGIFNSINNEVLTNNLQNLTDFYAEKNFGTDFIILYGNRTRINALLYKTEELGSIGIEFGTTPALTYSQNQRRYNATLFPSTAENEIIVILNQGGNQQIRQSFTLKPGEMFFIILKKEKLDEQFVSTLK